MMKVFSVAAAIAVSLFSALSASAETVAFQSRLTNGYVGTDASGLLVADAHRPNALVLDMIRLDGRRVAFRDPASGQFLRAGVGQDTYLSVTSPHIRGWETFELMQDGPDVRIRAVQNGLYVGTDGSQRLTARWGTQGLGQTFRLVPMGGPASTGPAPAPDTLVSGPARRGASTEESVPADLWFAGRWRVIDFNDGSNRSMPGLNDRNLRELEINIGRSGGVLGYSGCNSFTAQIVKVGEGVRHRVKNFSTNKFSWGCAGGLGEMQRVFYDGLKAMEAVEGSPSDMIKIRDRNGRVRLRLAVQR